MNKFVLLLGGMLMAGTSMVLGQGAKNIKINEVLTNNATSLQDEFGQHLPWVELANTSFSTYNVRGMFIATDKKVLSSSLTAPQRIAMMSPIPNGEKRTSMSGRDHLILFLNSNPSKGALHLTAKVEPEHPLWIALYDGNGIDLIDSVSVPALTADKSYARIKDGNMTWDVKPQEAVTPGIGNYIEINESKIAKLKRDDPYGLGITVLSMGIVFFCLALLYVFFTLFGKIVVRNKAQMKAAREEEYNAAAAAHRASLAEKAKEEPTDQDVYMAVIALALKQYMDDVHDEESGIITIKPHHTMWNNEIN